MDDRKKAPEPHNDLLTTAAEAIGSTLGKLAVRVGIAKPPAAAAGKRKPASRKRAPARKAAARVSRKAVSKKKAAKAPIKRTRRGPA